MGKGGGEPHLNPLLICVAVVENHLVHRNPTLQLQNLHHLPSYTALATMVQQIFVTAKPIKWAGYRPKNLTYPDLDIKPVQLRIFKQF
jgi:hypothetical protein